MRCKASCALIFARLQAASSWWEARSWWSKSLVLALRCLRGLNGQLKNGTTSGSMIRYFPNGSDAYNLLVHYQMMRIRHTAIHLNAVGMYDVHTGNFARVHWSIVKDGFMWRFSARIHHCGWLTYNTYNQNLITVEPKSIKIHFCLFATFFKLQHWSCVLGRSFAWSEPAMLMFDLAETEFILPSLGQEIASTFLEKWKHGSKDWQLLTMVLSGLSIDALRDTVGVGTMHLIFWSFMKI